jgi:hypothetical protein
MRFVHLQNLFRNEETTEAIEVVTGSKNTSYRFQLKNDNNMIYVGVSQANDRTNIIAHLNYIGIPLISNESFRHIYRDDFFSVRSYQFVKVRSYPNNQTSFLLPPDGKNLFSLVTSNKEFKELMRSYYKEYDLDIIFKPQEMTFEVFKRIGDEVFAHPYINVSDTFQRMFFYMMAVRSNRNSMIVFEEPEVHSFPLYLKTLGQMIGDDTNGNQYFISTHNPYLLQSLMEKTNENDLRVNIVSYRDHETKVKQLKSEEVSELMTMDPFFNLNRFLDE